MKNSVTGLGLSTDSIALLNDKRDRVSLCKTKGKGRPEADLEDYSSKTGKPIGTTIE